MRERSPFGSSVASSSLSWWRRIRENASQLFVHSAASPGSANGAPIHLLHWQGERRARSHAASLVIHTAALAALLAAAELAPKAIRMVPAGTIPRLLPLYRPSVVRIGDAPSAGRQGGGGANDPVPPTHGFLPPHSAVRLAPPRLPDQQNHALPVSVTIFDADAPPLVSALSNLGLPEMQEATNSGGPGRSGIGTRGEHGVGNRSGPGDGEGDEGGPYAAALSLPACLYCPTPVYTDEARHLKVQGTVTLRVKVGSDGRAADVRVLRGVGYGLEERAMESVRSWKFKPARDASGHVIPAWITIEAVFRLF